MAPRASNAVPRAARPAAAGAPAPLGKVLQGEAKAAYEEGRLLYNDGDAPGAYTKFKRAYDLSAEPRLLWNMAACEKSQRHYARAYSLVGRYLRDGGSVLTAENRATAQDTQKALRGFYSLVALPGAPAGARVVVDGEAVGKTPLQELVLDLGVHTIRVEADGFDPFESRVDVPGTIDTTVTVTMTRPTKTAHLAIAADAEDSVLVDNKLVATGRWEGPVAAGEHAIDVRGPGKKPYQITVDLRPGATRTIQVTLVDEAKSGGSAWPWILGGVAVVGGAAAGGYFLLRPKDQPGSTPDTSLGAVMIPRSR